MNKNATKDLLKNFIFLAGILSLALGQSLHAHPGDLDPTFGQNGTAIIQIPGVSSVESGNAVAVQPDGKVVIAGSADNNLAILRLNADGTKDTSFGSGGKVSANFSGNYNVGNAVAVLPNGKIMVAGSANTSNNIETFLVARYLTNGVLDTTFGISGFTNISFGNPANSSSQASAMAIQPDGKIVLVGSTFVYGNPDTFAVARLNADGSLDSTFGTGGKVITFPSSNSDSAANAVVLQSDGKILVAGFSDGLSPYGYIQFTVARYLTNGSLDSTFGTNGLMSVGHNNRDCVAYGIALQSNGKIIVGGQLDDIDTDDVEGGFMVARLNMDGSLDTTFGETNGVSVLITIGSVQNNARALLVYSDDSIQLVGSLQLSGHGLNYASVLFNPDGSSSDGLTHYYSANLSATNYNEQGFAAAIIAGSPVIVGKTQQNDAGDIGVVGLNNVQSFGQFPGLIVSSYVNDVAEQANGKIVAVGCSGSDNHIQSLSVARLNMDGTQDTTFGDGGVFSVNNTNGSFFGNCLAIQSDGKIVIAGTSANSSNTVYQLLLQRFTSAGALDPTFGANGVELYNPVGVAAYGAFNAVRIQSDGKIIAAGGVPVANTGNLLVARFLTNGTPDSTFGNGGFVTVAVGSGSFAFDMLVLPNGKIITAGQLNGGNFGAVQFNPDGSLDPTFGNGGIQTYNLGGSPHEYAESIAVQSDGKIVISGQSTASDGFTTYAGIIRCLTNGTLDITFGTGGIVRTNFSTMANTELTRTRVKIQANGRIVVGGDYFYPYTNDFVVFRLLSNGTVDSSFGTNGLVLNSTLSGNSGVNGLAIRSDGSIVAASSAATAGVYSFGFARFLGDPTSPLISVPSNVIAEATSASGAVVNFTTSATNSSGAVTTTNMPASGSTFPLGITTVTVTATDTNGTATNTFTVKVQDTTPPVITVSSNIVAEATSAAGAVVTFTTTATDLVSGTLATTNLPTSGSIFPLGTTTVTVTAGDAAGNISTNTFTVKVQDTTPPVITLLGGNRLTNYINSVFTDPGATATDTVAGNLTSAIVVTGTVNTNVAGSYLLTYTVSDSYSNTASTNRTVVIVAPTPPVLSIALTSASGLTTKGSGNFGIASTPGVGLNPLAVVAFTNVDGRVVLICANNNGNTLTLLTNSGSGIYSSNLTLNVRNLPSAITMADVNGDGQPDLICANINNGSPGSGNNGTLTVFINNGSGIFSSNATYNVGSYPTAVITADVNHDGKPDLICANYGNSLQSTLSVLTNNGSGGFLLATTINVGNASGLQAESVTAADVNNDGWVDLICVNNGGGSGTTLSVFTNNGNSGFSLASTPGGVGNGPVVITTADVNHDGWVDLITANYGRGAGNTLSVLTNNRSGGFSLAASPVVGHGVYAVAAADVNNDGWVDLISANIADNTLSVLTNNQSGGFVTAGTNSVGGSPVWITAADVNRDGGADLISANGGNNTLTVLTNSSSVVTSTITGVVISWPSPSIGFVLQQNINLTTTNWTTNSAAITTVNSTNSVIIAPLTGNQFFRLAHP